MFRKKDTEPAQAPGGNGQPAGAASAVAETDGEARGGDGHDGRGIRLTEAAIEKVREFAGQHEEARDKSLRIYIQGGSKASWEYGFTFDEPNDRDEVLSQGDLDLVVDRLSLMYMEGSEVDFVDDARGSGFVVDNPTPPPLLQDPVAAQVQRLIEERINPGVAMHGGQVQLLDYDDGRVYLEMGGGCQGCGMADVTLKQGIEQMLRQEIPEITEIIDQTDHAAGTNPYYSSAKGG